MKTSISPDQLAMFEPSGPELASLAGSHASVAASCIRKAENLELRGFSASAAAYYCQAFRAFDRSYVCELALQFETLAGLS